MRLRKGSRAAKAYMAKLRELRRNPLVKSESAEILDHAADNLLHIRRLRAMGRGGETDKALEAYLYGKAAAQGFIAGMHAHTSEHGRQGFRIFRTAQRLGVRAVKQDLAYHEKLKRKKNPMEMLILGNPPTPGTVATVTYSPEFQEFTVTTRDAARKVLGTYFTNDHADALGTARMEAETVKDRTKRRPPNPLTEKESRRLISTSVGLTRVGKNRMRLGRYSEALELAALAQGLQIAAIGHGPARGHHRAYDHRRDAANRAAASLLGNARQQIKVRGVNPATPCPKGCPPHLWADPEFRREYAVYRTRHGDGPIELRRVTVPNGFPKYLSVYGRVPELKYDAPKNSTKGRRIHHFGKRGKKSTMPFAVTSASRGPKFLALVDGSFKAKPDWIFD